MYNIFKENLAEAERLIKAASDHELASLDFDKKIAERCSIATPYLDKSKMKPEIGQMKPDRSNAPSGFSYVPGQECDFASYTIPVQFGTEVPDEVLKKVQTDFNLGRAWIDHNNWRYIQFSDERIIGDEDLISQIKTNAVKAFTNAEKVIAEYAEEVKIFNEITLPNKIQPILFEELQKRSAKKDATSLKNDAIEGLKF